MDKTPLKSMTGERGAAKHSFLHHNGCLQFLRIVERVIENVKVTELAPAKIQGSVMCRVTVVGNVAVARVEPLSFRVIHVGLTPPALS